MNGFRLASAILRSVWLVDDLWAENNLVLAQMLLEGKSIEAESKREIVNLDSRLTRYQYRDGWNNAPKGSFAFYNITGPILHYGWCDDGSHELNQSFKEAESNPNISGHFLFMDTPGGQADGVKEFAETILNASKPSVAFVNGGMIASGGVWLASAADAIYASSELCQVGSVGAFSTLIDTSERDQKEGIKRIIIKAKQSRDKNTVYELAKKGDEKALKELTDDVSVLAAHFIDGVKTGRAGKLTTEEWSTGKMYLATRAVKFGLIDGICTMEQALDHLSSKSIKNGKKNNMEKFKNVIALADKETVTQEDLDQANADLTAEGITHVTLVEQSVIDEAARVTEELGTVREELTTANSTVTTLETTIVELQTKVTTLEGVISKRASGDNGAAVSKKAGKDGEINDTIPKKVSAHNKVADRGIFG